ncbi:MAG: DciA family protein [bacterium]
MYKFSKAGELVKTVLERSGINEINYAIFDIWEKEAGGLVRVTEVVGLSKGILRVKVAMPACYQELLIRKKQLLTKINKHFGSAVLRDIKVISSNE